MEAKTRRKNVGDLFEKVQKASIPHFRTPGGIHKFLPLVFTSGYLKKDLPSKHRCRGTEVVRNPRTYTPGTPA